MNGFVNLNKPQGMTSRKAVNIMQRLTGIRKIGHAGTLDPMVTGVLPICIGAATRLIEYMEIGYKTYEGELTLGIKTDTQDIWGTVLYEDSEGAGRLTEDEIRDAFSRFQGNIMQTPPQYSAVRVAGKRLYEYARNGETMQVEPRPVHIKDVKIHEIAGGRTTFQIECSKGTYIRTICNDVGELLGCGAVMSRLVRTKNGVFQIEDAVTLEEVEAKINEGSFELLPMDFPLAHMDRFEIKKREYAVMFVNGGYVNVGEVRGEKPSEYYTGFPDIYCVKSLKEYPAGYPTRLSEGDRKTLYRAYYQGTFIGVAEYSITNRKAKAHKVFDRAGL